MVLSILLATFLVTAFGFLVANAWVSLANAMFARYTFKDPKTGKEVYPVSQMFLYSAIITLVAVGILWSIHTYKVLNLGLAKS